MTIPVPVEVCSLCCGILYQPKPQKLSTSRILTLVMIGNALGYGQSVTTGIISALNRDVTLQNDDGSLINNSLIQTDAPCPHLR